MRGSLSMLFSSHPEVARLRRGLIVLACSDRYSHRIVQAVTEWMPHVTWTILQREETVFPKVKGQVFLSRGAEGISGKWELLRRMRGERFDIVVTTWTNEPTYAGLKLFSVLADARFVLAYNENIDAVFLVPRHARTFVSHLWWRLTHRPGGRVLHPLLNSLSWLFLFPLGVVYLVTKTLFVVLRERLRPR